MKTTPHTIFSRRTLALLVGIGLLAFAGTLVIAGFADLTSPQQRAGANSYSTSAIGHLAFVELIRTAGLPVVRSRSRSLAKAGPNDLLIVAEPPASTAESGEINYMMRAHNTLVILPKWAGTPDRKKPRLDLASRTKTGQRDQPTPRPDKR